MTFKNSTAVYVQVQFPLSKEIKIRSHQKLTTADSILSKRYMLNVKTFETLNGKCQNLWIYYYRGCRSYNNRTIFVSFVLTNQNKIIGLQILSF